MNTFTIGFTKKSASSFFNLIKKSGSNKLLDVRLNNASQLAGFAKKDDLKFFLQELCNASYIHIPDLAPTPEILSDYQKKKITWEKYEDLFLDLMARRRVENFATSELFENSCLLCSEHEPHFCHRRLVTEYINKNTNLNLIVKHLY